MIDIAQNYLKPYQGLKHGHQAGCYGILSVGKTRFSYLATLLY